MSAHTSAALSLESAPCGWRLRILSIVADCPDQARLRELGFSPAATIRKLAHSSALICLIHNTRIALNPELGRFIEVEPA